VLDHILAEIAAELGDATSVAPLESVAAA
jgi:hypothetical protein